MIYIQLIGILAFCILVLSYYNKKTSTIIAYQIVANFIYTVHYFLLGALSGAYISFVGIFRNIAYLKVKKHKKILASVVISLYLLITLVFYENVFSLLPLVANSQYLLCMLKNDKKVLLISSVASSSLWATYAIFVGSYSGMITESILIISNAIQLIRLKSR